MLGLDPMVSNPGDPWKRVMNYPRIWQALYSIGVSESSAALIGITFIALFLCGLYVFMLGLTGEAIGYVVLAGLSPAIMLGIERGNNDLFVFFLISVSVVMLRCQPFLSAFILAVGSFVKLFPIFGIVMFLRLRVSSFIYIAGGLLMCFAVYVLATYHDIKLITDGTPKPTALAFGFNVFWMRLAGHDYWLGMSAMVVSYFLLGLVLFRCVRFLEFRSHRGVEESRWMDYFRAGGAIYVGCFLSSNSWDYRLMFLVFTFPQLVIWMRGKNRVIAVNSTLVLCAAILSLWHLKLDEMWKLIAVGKYISFISDEILNWVVFGGLCGLLAYSLPGWLVAAFDRFQNRKVF